MSNHVTWQTVSMAAKQTEALGHKLGQALKGGETIELLSDVGGGKTTFVRGLVRGLHSNDHVASPTFTISREYSGRRIKLFHYDFYRLQGTAGHMTHDVTEHVNQPHEVVVVEWGEPVKHVLPAERLQISIQPISDSGREFTFSAPAKLHYLIDSVRS